ncbi:MAG TPA: septation protein SepH, partial [Kribbella sp.]
VPVDDRLRAALRGDRARLGQLEIQMESALRPRDIQARIRAGESPEAVAAVAQMPMERVMAFAGPVLAERDHIATLAQRASVRRRGGGDAPTRNLGAWVTDRLRLRHVDPASAEWDAWRREDGRWAVRVSYFVESEDTDDSGEEQKDEKIGMFAYDAPGRYVVPDDDEARWLVGEQAQVLPTPVQPQPGERRLAAVADIDPLIAPDHGADSYEAGFEDTVALRRRNHPVSRDDTRGFPADGSGYSSQREGSQGYGSQRDGSGYGSQRDGSQSYGSQRDGREDYPREVSRAPRDPERGPRRVHSVPNPDEEPTLIDVPVDQPPAPRPSVRAVERPTTPPTYASPATEAGDYRDDPSARHDRGHQEQTPHDFRDTPNSRGNQTPRDYRDEPAARTSRDAQAPRDFRDAPSADTSRGEQAPQDFRDTPTARDARGDQTPRDFRDAPSARDARGEQAPRDDRDAPSARNSRGEQGPRDFREEPSARGSRGEQAPVGRAVPSRTAEPRRAEPNRPTGPRPTAPRPTESQGNRPHPAEDDRPATARASDGNQQPEPAQARPAQASPAAPQPAATVEQPALPDGTEDAPAETPAEPKKKPARRGKRASVPSWDEIMFGKKAD